MATTTAVGGLGTQTPVSSASSAPGQSLNSNDFLQLLTTELQNQDPMNPMDDTQSVAQLAQFSALSATQELNTSFQNFQSNFGVMQAAGLIGKNVTVVSTDAAGNSSNITGTVGSIAVQNGSPYFTMTGTNGKELTDNNGTPLLFSTGDIVGIGN
jgi:flagellar basal-body rod modification protein FlgD